MFSGVGLSPDASRSMSGRLQMVQMAMAKFSISRSSQRDLAHQDANVLDVFKTFAECHLSNVEVLVNPRTVSRNSETTIGASTDTKAWHGQGQADDVDQNPYGLNNDEKSLRPGFYITYHKLEFMPES